MCHYLLQFSFGTATKVVSDASGLECQHSRPVDMCPVAAGRFANHEGIHVLEATLCKFTEQPQRWHQMPAALSANTEPS